MEDSAPIPPEQSQHTKGKRFAWCAYATVLVFMSVPALIYLAGIFGASANFHQAIEKNAHQFKDFRLYYAYGRLAASKEHHLLYDFDKQSQYYHDYASEQSSDDRRYKDYVPYPPQFALVAAPLAKLDLHTAFCLWTAVGLAIGVGGLVVLSPMHAGLTGAQIAFLVLACLASLPGRQCLMAGQTSWLVCGLTAIYLATLFRKQDIAAGACLALVVIKPPYAICLAAAALARRQYKTLIWAAGITLVLLGAAVAMLGSEIVPSYLKALTMLGSTTQFDSAFRVDAMICLRSVLSEFLPGAAALKLANAFFFLACAGILFCFARIEPDKKSEFGWAAGVLVTSYLITAPHVHEYDCLLLAIPAAMLVKQEVTSLSRQIWWWLLATYPVTSCLLYLALPEDNPVMAINHVLLLINAILLRCAIKQLQPVIVPAQSPKPSSDSSETS